MRILVVNQPLNNRGDESAHKALIRSIIQDLPDAHVQVLFVGSNDDSIRQFAAHSSVQYTNLKKGKFFSSFMKYGLYTGLFSIWNLHPTVRKVRRIIHQSDIILCAPGGICMGGFHNWQHIAYLYMAKRMNKKIAYYGRSFGPFVENTKKNRRFKEISYELLHGFDFLSIRDQKTELLAKEIGVSYLSTVDAAFLDLPQEPIPDIVQSMIGAGDYMVLVPNVLIWHYSYKNMPKTLISYFFDSIIKLVLKEYPTFHIVLLPQTFNYKKEIDIDYNF
ncbi:MAG: polysaccharide pyruvyl transferase family protein, partial [Bacteroidales bacterium]|nr:polysaccharide pyruvyl transferase family protein [Bacteroidales bacterium]